MPRAHRLPSVFIALLGVPVGFGCGGSELPDAASADDVVAREVYEIRRRVCQGERNALADTDQDGRANVRTAFIGEQRACEELDLNMDGRVDVTRLYNEQGQLWLEQHDFDFDGRLDQQAVYEGGKLVRKELDTNFDKVVDTWVWCEGPLIARLERDRHHTGRVDTWETYERGRLASVVYDDNNDGNVERWETYKDGLLATVAVDTDLNGQPDTPEPKAILDAGGPSVDPVSCDGSPLPHIESPSTKTSPPPAPDDEDDYTDGTSGAAADEPQGTAASIADSVAQEAEQGALEAAPPAADENANNSADESEAE